ncbi:ethanolamine utilization protein [Bacillus canaveralius]|uniref:Ethanolamine utilization protein n=1 Tax=Bacillus canaveralius TaxID=1403243 RepID=A0A2N5GI33_9BACI|nr:BMC domain-containing protein [Bacillus canaveralius]PLR80568.1 ethanolamine utilization protein [Bacillus canaveralius]PLR92516.1 ethanolamine utilization protein [Bacillus canaveralius]
MTKALGMVETRGLAASIEVADAMLKNANVSLVKQSMVDAALVTILVEGDVSAVQSAVESGKKVAERTKALVAFHVIPHPDIDTSQLIEDKNEVKQLKNEREQTDKQSADTENAEQ